MPPSLRYLSSELAACYGSTGTSSVHRNRVWQEDSDTPPAALFWRQGVLVRSPALQTQPAMAEVVHSRSNRSLQSLWHQRPFSGESGLLTVAEFCGIMLLTSVPCGNVSCVPQQKSFGSQQTGLSVPLPDQRDNEPRATLQPDHWLRRLIFWPLCFKKTERRESMSF